MELSESLRELCANTIRFLCVDAIEKANSGHPGIALGCADLALEIFVRHLRYNPQNPSWPNRDRFVLSAGHGSSLLYALLHLAGYDLPLDEVKKFRQLKSKTPGHPEVGVTPGVEVTTGPLGQGIANAVGIALAGKMLHARFSQQNLVNYRVFGLVSDGDLMEGISWEAASIAGHLGINNLVLFYDDNKITIDGDTDLAMSDNTPMRFESCGWFVQSIDGHDPIAIRKALDAAVAEPSRPSLICARTHIGLGSPNKVDSCAAHGAALGKDEVALTKKALHWPLEPAFFVPSEVREVFANRAREIDPAYQAWSKALSSLSPEARAQWDALFCRQVPANLGSMLFELAKELANQPESTRAIAGKLQQLVARAVPGLVGGSADLTASNCTAIAGASIITRRDFSGRNIHFGVREHAMGSINNGLAVSGPFIPYGSTFLVFSDYLKPSLRLAAMSKLQNIFVFTHDSIFVGEDGPTHQPIEQIATMRMLPNLRVVRPADAYECAAAWQYAINRKTGPTALILSRQKLPILPRSKPPELDCIVAGAYRIVDPADANLVIIATGSEVFVAMGAAEILKSEGIVARVISAPCLEALEDLGPDAYAKVLPTDNLPRVSIEAGRTTGWQNVIGRRGLAIGINTFGSSGPDKILAQYFGITTESVVERIRAFAKSAPV